MAAKKSPPVEINTGEKIKAAARKVFMRKGFSATRTRDIAAEAGINLALLNYYFHSKKQLFELVMQGKYQKLFGTIFPLLNDPSTTLETKVELITNAYIDVLCESPDLPLFVLNELRKKNFELVEDKKIKMIFIQSSFIKQLKEKRPDIDPLHFLITIIGMAVFPFVVKPMLLMKGMVNEKSFITLMNERRKLIPVWVKAILKAK